MDNALVIFAQSAERRMIMLNGAKVTREFLNALDSANSSKNTQTNADRFRAMSDEEQQNCVRKFWEIEDFADWLKQPAN